MTCHRAPAAPRPQTRPRFGAAALRIAVGAIFMASALAVPQVAAPAAAQASSCTGWTSRVSPPRTIRVLRTRSGRIQKVAFRKYVAEVMASGEWPSRLRNATLEAGAVATKQYAWYYAMKGHHRKHYRRGGKCYDVRDDTRDQLYRPERAKPTARQQRAINKTWALTLRKGGRFFLTGYRAGVRSGCAADANGWKLYAKSVEACARKGWSRQRIQRAYLHPNLEFVWSKRLGPVLKRPAISLRPGTSLDGGAVTVSWKPAAPGQGVVRYRLQQRIGNGKWRDVSLPSTNARKATVRMKTGVKNRLRVMAIDNKGRPGPWAYSDGSNPVLRGPVGRTLGGDGTAGGGKNARSGGGSTAARARFVGHAVAFVTETGPGMGKAMILVGGKRVATVNLEREKTTERALVWTRNWRGARWHTVTVKPVGRGSRVDFEGFFILR